MLEAAQDAEWHFVLSVFQNLSEPFRSKRLKMPSGYCRCGLQLGKFLKAAQDAEWLQSLYHRKIYGNFLGITIFECVIRKYF